MNLQCVDIETMGRYITIHQGQFYFASSRKTQFWLGKFEIFGLDEQTACGKVGLGRRAESKEAQIGDCQQEEGDGQEGDRPDSDVLNDPVLVETVDEI
jgi:hypothetical protein